MGEWVYLYCMRRHKPLFEKAGLKESNSLGSSIVAAMEAKELDFLLKPCGMKRRPDKSWPLVPCYGQAGMGTTHVQFACDGDRFSYASFSYHQQSRMINLMELIFELLKRSHNDEGAVRVGLSLTGIWHGRIWVRNNGLFRSNGPALELEDGQKIWMKGNKICLEPRG